MTGNNGSPESVSTDAASEQRSANRDTVTDEDLQAPGASEKHGEGIADNEHGASTISPDSESDAASEPVPHHDDPLGFGDQRMNAGSGAEEHCVDADEYGIETEEPDIEELTARLQQAEAKATEHWERLLRMQADMENQRKRSQNEVTKARKFALEGIVSDLLPVKDSLELGLAAASADDVDPKAIVEGAELTLKMLAQVFEKHQIMEVNPVDEKFDPEFHQAMSMQEAEGKQANTVTSVMQKGYTLNDRLVRPALVMVAK